MWAIKHTSTGEYQKNVSWREDSDLEHAKLYFRKGNALSAITYSPEYEVVEIRLIEIK